MAYSRAVHHPNGDFGYLEAKLRSEAELPTKFAIDAHGRVTTRDAARTIFNRTHRRRWGAVDVSLARTVLEKGDGPVQIHVQFRDDTATSRVESLEREVQNRGADIKTKGGDIVEFRVNDSPPSDWVRRIGKNRHVENVSYVAHQSKRYGLTGLEGPAHYTNTDDEFNADGNYADTMTIGILDTSYNGCASHIANHIAFESATVEYTHSITTCDTDDGSDCPKHPDGYVDCVSRVNSDETARGAECKDLANDGISEKVCVVPDDKDHETEVTSRIVQRRDDPTTKRHAAEIHLVIYNGEDYFESAGAYRTALNTLANRGVDIINKSWGQDKENPDYGEKAKITDQFIKDTGITVVHGSGNGLYSNHHDHTYDIVCEATSSLCVGATHAEGTRDDFTNDDHVHNDIVSLYQNPRDADGNRLEQEEPDIMSEGMEAKIAQPGTQFEFVTGEGTSYAAPTIGGLLALFDQECGFHSDLRDRVLARQSAWNRQTLEDDPDDPIYPTYPPVTIEGRDSVAGTGIVDGPSLSSWCGDSTPGSGEGDSGEWDGGGWSDAPSWMESTDMDSTRTNMIDHGEWAEVVGPLSWPLSKGSAEVNTFAQLAGGEVLPDGTRIRASLTYQSCTTEADTDNSISYDDDNTPAYQPEVDIDLALCGRDADTDEPGCIVGSTSMHDVNEGFDATLSKPWYGIRLFAVRDKNDDGCGGDEGDPGAWAYNWWVP